MGIYDRDYIRKRPPPAGGYGGGGTAGGLSSLKAWSVNTWLILACVAVFVIDGFLPPRLFLMDTTVMPNVGHVDVGALKRGRPVQVAPGVYEEPLHVPAYPQVVVAVNRYQKMRFLQGYLYFSTARAFLIRKTTSGLMGLEFWRFIGFQFVHANVWHLVLNMIGLYFFGPLVEGRLGRKRYLAFYLLCGIFGALMYLLLNLGGLAAASVFGHDVRIPGLLFNDVSTPLIGASAGVFGVLMAGASIAPNAVVLLFFVLPMRFATFAYAFVAIALFVVIFGGDNAGGQAAHLGGAIAGFYFIRHPHHLHGFFDILGWADPTSHHYRHAKGRRAPPPSGERAEIDRILDKISESGLKSLSEKEKRILREASDR
jgi:membrane associated rhomboid family serine protease